MKKTYIVCQAGGFVYAAIPKVACGSIKRAIAVKLGLDPAVSNVHSSSFGWDLASQPAVAQMPLFCFAFVRNPYDRLLSCYSHKVARFRGQNERSPLYKVPTDWTFERFVQWAFDRKPDSHYAPQVKTLVFNGALMADFVGRFERLTEDWQSLAERFSLPPLESSNRTAHKPYRKMYTPELRRLVEEYYARDLETFGYEF